MKKEIQPKTERVTSYNFETTRVGETLYNVEKLQEFAEKLPTQEIETETLKKAVAEGHYYWIDDKENKLGPHDILKDWENAQQNKDWADHIAVIKRANLERPLWVTRDGLVFNGMHRLTKAFLEGVPKVKVKIFDQLPEFAVVEP